MKKKIRQKMDKISDIFFEKKNCEKPIFFADFLGYKKNNCLYYCFLVPNVGKFCSELGIDLILNKLEQQKGNLLLFYYTKQTSETLPTTV
jgi:hypothetical protein